MFKYLAIIFLLGSPLFAYPLSSPELNEAMQSIYCLKESHELIAQIEREGAISIMWTRKELANTNAAWVPDLRTIYINGVQKRTKGSIIRSILFELHNALSDRDFSYYDTLAEQRKISMNDYVEAIERIEHRNAMKTIALLEKGIQKTIFPNDARWYIPSDFSRYFAIQIESGHATAIAQVYNSVCIGS